MKADLERNRGNITFTNLISFGGHIYKTILTPPLHGIHGHIGDIIPNILMLTLKEGFTHGINIEFGSYDMKEKNKLRKYEAKKNRSN